MSNLLKFGLWVGSLFLWAWFGYMTAKADSRHDVVGYRFGLLFIFLLPVVVGSGVIKDAIGDWKSHRRWEREHGKPWRESEAAKIRREIDRGE